MVEGMMRVRIQRGKKKETPKCTPRLPNRSIIVVGSELKRKRSTALLPRLFIYFPSQMLED